MLLSARLTRGSETLARFSRMYPRLRPRLSRNVVRCRKCGARKHLANLYIAWLWKHAHI